ncbi:MAG TPA: cyclodeaminase/cyclohydrolase family protein [Streptosporangiaceae bacterium]
MTDRESGPVAGDQAIGAWLDELGSAAPAPGGGAAAAMSVATAAALVEMVGNLTVGRSAYAGHEAQVTAVRDAARRLRQLALGQIDEDAQVFRALMAAYRLPRDTIGQRAARGPAIQVATRRAAGVPLDVAATAAEVIQLAAELPGRSNPNVLSDVGVAAALAAAAIEAAAINVDVNLATLTDAEAKAELTAQLAGYLTVAVRGRELAGRVRRDVAG